MKYRVTGIVNQQVETTVEASNEAEARTIGMGVLKQKFVDTYLDDLIAENLDESKLEVIDLNAEPDN